MLYLVAILGILILAHTAVYHIRRADVYRRMCVEYRMQNLRLQGKIPTEEDVEEEIAQRAEEIEKGEF